MTMEETYESDSTTYEEDNDDFPVAESQELQNQLGILSSQASNTLPPTGDSFEITKSVAKIEKALPKPFKCLHCSCTYVRKSQFEKHIRDRHHTAPTISELTVIQSSLPIAEGTERSFLTWACSSQWLSVRTQNKGP